MGCLCFCIDRRRIESVSYSPVGCTSTSPQTGGYKYTFCIAKSMQPIPFVSTTSLRTAYRSQRLFIKSHFSLILSQLLSKPKPLCWASVWFWGANRICVLVLPFKLEAHRLRVCFFPCGCCAEALVWFWALTGTTRHLYCGAGFYVLV